MFPAVNDMNLVVYGLATFAATVGYACSRKLTGPESRTIALDPRDSSASTGDLKGKAQDGSGTSDIPDSTSSEVGESPRTEALTGSPSLKRKRAQDDEHEDSLANLQLIYPPKKRSKTPSFESESAEVLAEIVPSVTVVDTPEEAKVTPELSSEDESLVATPPPATPELTPITANERASTPPHVVFGSSATISSPLPKSIQPSKRPVTSKAFSAFISSGSAFATASPSKSGSLKPAWSMPNFEKNANDVTQCELEEGTLSHVLVAAATAKTTVVEHLTGEEQEDVELELKGVRMYVKRGDKPFSEGMLGHVKLLSDKSTLDERLLFRREPLWQVSMNVRIHPSLRCTFDADENVLRIIHTKPVEQKDECEIVIYALKPGRSCSKQDFKDFAEAFVKSPGLKAKVEP
ncbi:hypothetical protein DXG01_003921 [Tephrocybe rancida]|nr:hypothetical protein DXG01_003921 [Tephrocybe rancida]